MKVWQIKSGETDTICGYTLIHALQEYFTMTGTEIYDLSDTDKIKQIPASQWEKHIITYEDGIPDSNVKIYMEGTPDAGLICSTAYSLFR